MVREVEHFSDWTHHTCFHCGQLRLMKRKQYVCKFCEEKVEKSKPPKYYRLHGLRRIRRRKDITQVELAYIAGVAPGTIEKCERGVTRARPKTAEKIAQALGTTIASLVRR